jgi:surface antigen
MTNFIFIGVFMLNLKKTLTLGVLALTLTGCAGQGPKQTGGQLLGGAAGALIGSQFGKGTGQLVGVAIGALAGSYIGGTIGYQLDEKDKALAQENMINSLENAPDQQTQGWHNPNSHHSGTFKVTHTQEMPTNHLVCRDYVQTVTIDGKQEEVQGRACRDMRDTRAAWKVQS